jgi:exodeoxyribonuclease VII large subunit
VPQILDALRVLDADETVDVIVIARGGGSVEDLLPFSNEAMVRAVAAARTPVISAIGHETDRPLLDLVADVAASTPTDAARQVVPDLASEIDLVDDLVARLHHGIHRRFDREAELVAGLPERLHAATQRRVDTAAADVLVLRDRARRRVLGLVDAAASDVEHVAARIRALSPQATLERGYAVVQNADGVAVRDPADATGELSIRVATGRFTAQRTS